MAFPYATRFNEKVFDYLSCLSCGAVYVDPVPDADTFEKMYTRSTYHDAHYSECESPHYRASAILLRQYLPAEGSVLDYGAGSGYFSRR